jgi:hypothetical protein
VAIPDRAPTVLTIPDWIPEPVANAARALQAQASERSFSTLVRLVTDQRMKRVWHELSKRSKKNGSFLHPAKRFPWLGSDDPAAHQHAAMTSLLREAFILAVQGPSVMTRRQLETWRANLLSEAAKFDGAAKSLRERSPNRVGVDATPVIAEAAHARRADADMLAAAKSSLIVGYDTGDGQPRCFAILLAATCREYFNHSMYGIVATMASVALGREVSSRAVREWCNPSNS